MSQVRYLAKFEISQKNSDQLWVLHPFKIWLKYTAAGNFQAGNFMFNWENWQVFPGFCAPLKVARGDRPFRPTLAKALPTGVERRGHPTWTGKMVKRHHGTLTFCRSGFGARTQTCFIFCSKVGIFNYVLCLFIAASQLKGEQKPNKTKFDFYFSTLVFHDLIKVEEHKE